MADVFFIRTKNKVEMLTLDAVLSERYEATSEVTRYPVENGSTISDQIYNSPIRLSIDGAVSSYHLTDGIDTSPSSAFDYLEKLREKRDLITIVTGLKTYREMAIESLNVTRDAKNSVNLFRFSLTAVYFKVVKASFTEDVTVAPAVRKKVTTVKTVPPLKTISVDAIKFKPSPAPSDCTKVYFKNIY